MSKDLISRQAAIDALRDYLVGKRCPDDGTLTCRLIENEVVNKLPSALSTNLAEVGTDLISRQDAIEAVQNRHMMLNKEKVLLINDLEKLPSAEPKRMTGHWRHYEGELECSVCGARFYDEIMEFCGDGIPHFCLDCGADMRGEQDG